MRPNAPFYATMRRPSAKLVAYTKELKQQMGTPKVANVLGCSFVTVEKILDGFGLIRGHVLDALEAKHGKQ